MTTGDIRLLFAYNRWADARTLEAASALSPEQFTRDLGASFRSVCGTLVHIMGGEWGWLQYWKAASHTPEFLRELWDRHDVIFNAGAFADLPAVRRRWEEVEAEQAAFLSEATEESLQKLLPVGTTQVSLAHLMQHLVNHSTYHRGQVAVLLRQLGAEPLATDFSRFLVQISRQTTAAS